MKAHLMFKDHDFNLHLNLPSNAFILIKDLELNTLFQAMSLSDKFLYDVAMKAVLTSLEDSDTIIYRQNVLKDCLKNSSIVREIYHIVIETLNIEKKHYFGLFSKYPDAMLDMSLSFLEELIVMLKKLKDIKDKYSGSFTSEGFTTFFQTIDRELDNAFFENTVKLIKDLKFHSGVLISAGLGEGNKGTGYTLRKMNEPKQSWMKRILTERTPVYSFKISEYDEGGLKALSELKEMGMNQVANILTKSVDHILSFFKMLQSELGFYICCLNLHEQLDRIGEPTSFPIPCPSYERRQYFKELYDISLALTKKKKIVGNEINLDDKDFIIITGANQGGKSTFLRSIGIAQLMMQCGMFVSAEYYRANICRKIFTHFKREEDKTMNSGKFDEELGRMSDIVDHINSNSLLLFNESFAATNEREGSNIAKEIVNALLEKNIKIFFVTHLYEFANSFFDKKMENVIFLRADRQGGGERTFKMIVGEPLKTSYGEDLYNKIFS